MSIFCSTVYRSEVEKKDRERKKLTFVEQEVKPIKNASYAVKKVLNNDD